MGKSGDGVDSWDVDSSWSFDALSVNTGEFLCIRQNNNIIVGVIESMLKLY